MDAERRKELQRQFKDVGGFVSDVCRSGGPTVDELRALLADSEALDAVQALPEQWQRGESVFPPLSSERMIAKETREQLENALGQREDG